jgi:hypothetical protein
MSNIAGKPPPFPYVAVALFAGCVVAAVWMWMRYSYAWDVQPKDVCLFDESGVNLPNRYMGRYVRLKGVFADELPPSVFPGPVVDHLVRDPSNKAAEVSVCSGGAEAPAPGTRVLVCGRVVPPFLGIDLIINSTRSRWHGASIAGLVVGAMGVFVFTVALRHWMRERRRFREDARA